MQSIVVSQPKINAKNATVKTTTVTYTFVCLNMAHDQKLMQLYQLQGFKAYTLYLDFITD